MFMISVVMSPSYMCYPIALSLMFAYTMLALFKV